MCCVVHHKFLDTSLWKLVLLLIFTFWMWSQEIKTKLLLIGIWNTNKKAGVSNCVICFLFTGKEVRQKWKYLKDQFQIKLANSQQVKPTWLYCYLLLFLKDQITPKQMSSNLQVLYLKALNSGSSESISEENRVEGEENETIEPLPEPCMEVRNEPPPEMAYLPLINENCLL